MNIRALKIMRIERYIFALIMVVVMFVIAEMSGQKEVIFPEIVAIMTGAWIAERQPWNVNKRKMFLLIALSSLVGVMTVKYVHTHLFFQVLISFAFTGFSLILAKTNFIPIISACILPVYLRTDSWIYTISVTTMALIVIIAQWLMEKYHFRPKNNYCCDDFNMREEVLRWLKLLCIFALIALAPIGTHNIFFLAPPLIVTYAEFANPKSPLRKKPFTIWGVLVFAATVGVLMRLLLAVYLHFPLTVCVIFACILLFALFDYINIYFPPSGAILLLPMILPQKELFLFPFEVAVGGFVVILISMLLFSKKEFNR